MKKKIILPALLLSGGLAVGLQTPWLQSVLSAEGLPADCSSDLRCLLHPIKFEKPPEAGSRGLSKSGSQPKKPSSLSERDIRQVEQTLKEKGFNPGNVDGVLDQQTTAAIRAFQRANNLQETGIIDTVTADRLGITLQSGSGDTNRAE